MLFCPTCGNCLLLDQASGGMFFACKTCPYVFKISQSVSKKEDFEQKRVDDVIGEELVWEDCPQTTVDCVMCHFNKSYFREIQMRGLDEPATIFYRCSKCGYRWREG